MTIDDQQQLIAQIRSDISGAASLAEIDDMETAIGTGESAVSHEGEAYRDTGPYSDRYQDTPYDDHYKDTPTYRDAPA